MGTGRFAASHHGERVTAPMTSYGRRVDAETPASPSAKLSHLSEHLGAVSKEITAMSPLEAEAVLTHVIDALTSITHSIRSKSTSPSSRIQPIRRIVEKFIQSRLSCPNICADTISSDLEIPRSTLYRAFGDVGGIAKYIQEQRLIIAKSLILRPEEYRSLGQIASSLGFANCATFSKAFRKRFGRSPRSMRAFGMDGAAAAGWDGACRDGSRSEAA